MTIATLNEAACVAAIQKIFNSSIAKIPPPLLKHIGVVGGKLYELYCVSRLLEQFHSHYGLTIRFQGSSIILKASGGYADPSYPHFELYSRGTLIGKLFTDIEVGTLGATMGASPDLSAYHEVDIALLTPNHSIFPNRPSASELLFGVECKATASFIKAHVREVLGRRRELSFYTTNSIPGPFGPVKAVPPYPYWMVYIDPKGDQYKESPAVFGITLEHWPP